MNIGILEYLEPDRGSRGKRGKEANTYEAEQAAGAERRARIREEEGKEFEAGIFREIAEEWRRLDERRKEDD